MKRRNFLLGIAAGLFFPFWERKMPRFGAIGQQNWIVSVAASNSPQRFRNMADYVCDGTADQSEINSALNEAATFGNAGNPGTLVMLMPGTYTLSGSITVDDARTGLFGFGGYLSNAVSIDGQALGATTAAILVTVDNCTFVGLEIRSGGYGIELDGASVNGVGRTLIRDCHIHNCGNYGIWGHNQHFYTTIDHCSIINNANAQIYSVSVPGEQNGNNMSVVNSNFQGNSIARGLVWNATGLIVSGSAFELCTVGIDIGSNTTYMPNIATIIGNYFEANSIASVRIGDSGAGIAGNPVANTVGATAVVEGNVFTGTAGVTDFIVLSQMTAGYIGYNGFPASGLITGAQIRSSTVSEDVWIMIPRGAASPIASTFGDGRVLGSNNRQVGLNGDTEQIGLPWAEGSPNSGNLINTTDTGYFYFKTRPNDSINRFAFYMQTDGAANTATVTLQRLQAATFAAAWTTVQASEVLTGNGTFNYPLAAAMSIRVEDGYSYRLQIVVDATLGGGADTAYYVLNPRMTLATL